MTSVLTACWISQEASSSAAAVALRKEGRPDLGQLWLASVGDFQMTVPSYQVAKSNVAESAGLESCLKAFLPTPNSRPPISPPFHLPHPLS